MPSMPSRQRPLLKEWERFNNGSVKVKLSVHTCGAFVCNAVALITTALLIPNFMRFEMCREMDAVQQGFESRRYKDNSF